MTSEERNTWRAIVASFRPDHFRGAEQASLFYEFRLEDRIPKDHLLRRIPLRLPPVAVASAQVQQAAQAHPARSPPQGGYAQRGTQWKAVIVGPWKELSLSDQITRLTAKLEALVKQCRMERLNTDRYQKKSPA
jgi:hypothetical protein